MQSQTGERKKKKGERKCRRTDSEEDDTSQPFPTGRLNEDSEVWEEEGRGGRGTQQAPSPLTPPAGSAGHTMNREKMGRVLLKGASAQPL